MFPSGVDMPIRGQLFNSDLILFIVFNATFSSILAMSWRPVLEMEEAGILVENYRPWASNWLTLSLAAASRVHSFCNLQSWARTHAGFGDRLV